VSQPAYQQNKQRRNCQKDKDQKGKKREAQRYEHTQKQQNGNNGCVNGPNRHLVLCAPAYPY